MAPQYPSLSQNVKLNKYPFLPRLSNYLVTTIEISQFRAPLYESLYEILLSNIRKKGNLTLYKIETGLKRRFKN